MLFIGHMATPQGLEVDPAKVQAIIEMPAPTDKLGVQRLLGLAQYLAKFLPHLSDVTKPLRDLTQSNVLWVWNEAQQMAFEKLKEMVTRTPVLRYYNLKEEVTLQCDASQSGLGAALMQNGQPIVYASQAPTPAQAPECLRPYFDVRDELTIQNELVFKGQQIVVLAVLRKELMEKTHASHIGIQGSIRQARDTLYWPRITTEIKEYISRCDVCMTYRTGQGKEPILQHEFIAQPWPKVAADLYEFDNRVLLVVSDYYSNFIEVARLSSLTSRAVIKELKAVFARYGVPDTLVTDNGSQFSSAEFAVFAKRWMFKHKTSSPTYPQSNGKAEKAVQTVKNLFRKCKASGTSEFQALLDWHNTPTAGIGTSRAQRLMGRRCKTLLPIAGSLLQPNFPTGEDTCKLLGTK